MSAAVEHSPDQAQQPEHLPESTALDPSAIEARQIDAAAKKEATPPPQTVDDESKKVVSSVQKRIDELVRAKHEAERNSKAEVEHYARIAWEKDRELQRLAAERQQLEFKTSEPTLESVGGDVEKFIAARLEWQGKQQSAQLTRQQQEWMAQFGQQAQQQRQAEQAAIAAQQRAQAEEQFIKVKLEEGKKLFPDFDKVVTNPELPPMRAMNPAAFAAIMNSERGHEIAYQIAKDPLLAFKIANADPATGVREIGRLEGMLAAGKKITSAPPPPALVGAGASHQKSAEEMSMEEFSAWRKKNRRSS